MVVYCCVRFHSIPFSDEILVKSVWLIFSLKCVHRKLDIAGVATEMLFFLFQSIERPLQIPVAHFDQNRTIFNINFNVGLDNVRKREKPNSLTRDNIK